MSRQIRLFRGDHVEEVRQDPAALAFCFHLRRSLAVRPVRSGSREHRLEISALLFPEESDILFIEELSLIMPWYCTGELTCGSSSVLFSVLQIFVESDILSIDAELSGS